MNSTEALMPKKRKVGGTDHSPLLIDGADRTDWSKFSTIEMGKLHSLMGPELKKLMVESMGPEEKRDYIKRLAALAIEKIQDRAEFDKLIGETKSDTELADALGRLQEARMTLGIPQRAYGSSGEQNVALVTPPIPQNRQEVTVVAPDVTDLVAPSSVALSAKREEGTLLRDPVVEEATIDHGVADSVATGSDSVAVPVAINSIKVANFAGAVAIYSGEVVNPPVSGRAKRAEDGLYHCSQCDYVTDKAKNLWMHHYRHHR